jgi:hypothetical protein
VKRRQQPSGDLPAHLRRCVSEDWPGRDDAERYGAFVVAREAWKTVHAVLVLPDDERIWAEFPDGEFRPDEV